MAEANSNIILSSSSMNLDFRIIELQKRGISLISLGKRAECCLFCPKRAFANFFLPYTYLMSEDPKNGPNHMMVEDVMGQ